MTLSLSERDYDLDLLLLSLEDARLDGRRYRITIELHLSIQFRFLIKYGSERRGAIAIERKS